MSSSATTMHCAGCGSDKAKFSKNQRKRAADARKCPTCAATAASTASGKVVPLAQGMVVVLAGLTTSGMNGETAVVVGGKPNAKGRWLVSVHADGKQVTVKPENACETAHPQWPWAFFRHVEIVLPCHPDPLA